MSVADGNEILRRIICSHHMRVEIGSFSKMYRVELAINEGNGFRVIGEMFFNNHETAIALCLGRMAGNFVRHIPDSEKPSFELTQKNMMWEFVVEEYRDSGSVNSILMHGKRCRSRILARTSLSDEFAEYSGIGHMGVLGISHIIETISSDTHLGRSERGDMAMFSVNNKLYRITRFNPNQPCVFGVSVISGEQVSFNYHYDIVQFHRFGTVIKYRASYYLDGERLGMIEGDTNEALSYIAENYPHAKTYVMDFQCKSIEPFRKKNGHKQGE